MQESFGYWTVNDDGMEEANGYYIEKDRINIVDENGASRVALDVYKKTWCDPETFIPALKCLFERHGNPKIVNWEKTLASIQGQAYSNLCYQEAERRLRRTEKTFDAAILFETKRLMECGWYPPSPEQQRGREAHARIIEDRQQAQREAAARKEEY